MESSEKQPTYISQRRQYNPISVKTQRRLTLDEKKSALGSNNSSTSPPSIRRSSTERTLSQREKENETEKQYRRSIVSRSPISINDDEEIRYGQDVTCDKTIHELDFEEDLLPCNSRKSLMNKSSSDHSLGRSSANMKKSGLRMSRPVFVCQQVRIFSSVNLTVKKCSNEISRPLE